MEKRVLKGRLGGIFLRNVLVDGCKINHFVQNGLVVCAVGQHVREQSVHRVGITNPNSILTVAVFTLFIIQCCFLHSSVSMDNQNKYITFNL